MYMLLLLTEHNGCILGDPYGQRHKKVNLPSPTQSVITTITNNSKGYVKLALNLLSRLFTKEEIAEGICTTGDSGRSLLDHERINGIMCTLYTVCLCVT